MEVKDIVEKSKKYMDGAKPHEKIFMIVFLLFNLVNLYNMGLALYAFFFNKFYSISFYNIPAVFNRSWGATAIVNTTNWVSFARLADLLQILLPALLFYYILFVFVYKHGKEKGYSVWTWMLAIMFMPNYWGVVLYAIFAYRFKFIEFLKSLVREYKDYEANKGE